MRVAPKAPSKIEKLDKPESITQVRKYELITPLFGGGVKAGEADQITTIRGSSIRGQLRFWWRACRGGAFANLEQMKKAEDAIWGTASKDKKGEKPASKVQVFVEVQKHGNAVKPFEVIHKIKDGKPEYRNGKPVPQIKNIEHVSPSYTAFPLRPEHRTMYVNMPTAPIRESIAFSLNITYPKTLQSDIEAALWAWETFGGIGARTRRGFGAISLVSIDQQNQPLPKMTELKDFIETRLKKYVIKENWPLDLPHLTKNLQFKIIIPAKSNNAKDIWKYLIEKLKIFRQQRSGNPGRSRWPEPDSIRRITKQNAIKHPVDKTLENIFPRAIFGLPIIFQFHPKDRKEKNPYHKDNDPIDTSLYLIDEKSKNRNSFDRLSSPLILRPIKCDSNFYAGLGLLLEGTQQVFDKFSVILKTKKENKDLAKVQVKLTEKETSKISILNKETNILKAFLDFLTKQN